MKQFFRTYWPFIVFLFISSFLSFIWLSQSQGVFGTDTVFSLYRHSNFIENSWYTFDINSSWGGFSNSFSRIFLMLFESLVQNNYIIQLIIFFFLIFSALLWSYLFSSIFIKDHKKLVLFCSLIYTFGPFQYYYIWKDQTGFQWFLAFLPAFLYSVYNLFYKKNNKYLLTIWTISIIYGVAASTVFIVISFICMILLLIPLIINEKKRTPIMLKFILILLIFSWILIPQLLSINDNLLASVLNTNPSRDFIFNSQWSTFDNLFFQTAYKILYTPYLNENFSVNSDAFYYKDNLFFKLISITFLVILLLGLLFLNKNDSAYLPYRYLFLVYLFFLMISSNLFLITKANLINQIPFLVALRNSFNKFAIPIGLVVSLLLGISLNKLLANRLNKHFFNFILVVFLIAWSYPFFVSSPIFRGNMSHPSYYIAIPKDYFEFANSPLNEATYPQKIIYLPFLYYNVGTFNWIRMDGDTPIRYFTSNSVLTLKKGNEQLTYVIEAFNDNLLKRNYSELTKMLDLYGVNYIIIDNNQDWILRESLYKTNKIIPSREDYKNLSDHLEGIYPKNDFGNITVFSISDRDSNIRIFGENNYKVYKVLGGSPTRYIIFIEGISKDVTLNLDQTFNTNWNIYLRNQNFINILFIDSLVENKIFQNFSNSWTIDSEYIKSHYSKEYYKENPDGSIDIELTLYFKPQSYFYISLIISGATLIICIVCLIYDWRKEKEQEPKSK